MNLPLIITNFKATESSIGDNALKMAKIHQEVAQEKNVNIIIAVQTADLKEVTKNTDIPVYAQHIDGVSYGSHTGKFPAQFAKDLGAKGTILNHSENRFNDFEELKKAINEAKKVGLEVVCCAESVEEGEKISKETKADLIAIEPPELIGGDISVSTAQPELIEESVSKIGTQKVLVGAGIKNTQDVKIALKLGAQGILVASGITKSQAPKSSLEDLAKPMV
ncbi:MAG: triose-phosphate isomerase [Candidatus Gracilibacteria bacterium]|jgi:triosephosphate isomerase|nr:triose-phosphate isomerase [Candidatus Gracilibacteria bacterium]